MGFQMLSHYYSNGNVPMDLSNSAAPQVNLVLDVYLWDLGEDTSYGSARYQAEFSFYYYQMANGEYTYKTEKDSDRTDFIDLEDAIRSYEHKCLKAFAKLQSEQKKGRVLEYAGPRD